MNQPRKTILAVAVALGAAAIWTVAGCDEPTQSSKPATAPSVAVVTTQPDEAAAMVAAYPVKPPSTMNIDGKDISFPAAKLAVIRHGTGGFTLMLCSDDPPTAIDPGYVGNSYVLDMKLGIDHLSELPAASWDFKPTDMPDSASGIFLHGYREQFHPDDVHVSFQKDGDEMIVFLSGSFLHSDATNPAAPPARVQISATLRANSPAQ